MPVVRQPSSRARKPTAKAIETDTGRTRKKRKVSVDDSTVSLPLHPAVSTVSRSDNCPNWGPYYAVPEGSVCLPVSLSLYMPYTVPAWSIVARESQCDALPTLLSLSKGLSLLQRPSREGETLETLWGDREGERDCRDQSCTAYSYTPGTTSRATSRTTVVSEKAREREREREVQRRERERKPTRPAPWLQASMLPRGTAERERDGVNRRQTKNRKGFAFFVMVSQ